MDYFHKSFINLTNAIKHYTIENRLKLKYIATNITNWCGNKMDAFHISDGKKRYLVYSIKSMSMLYQHLYFAINFIN